MRLTNKLLNKFGYCILSKEELILREDLNFRDLAKCEALSEAKDKQLERYENEVEYYRRKYDEALNRADRQLDDLLQSNGLPVVTETTKRDQEKALSAFADKTREHEKEIVEMFSETLGVMHDVDGLELPDELRAEAAKLMEGKKAS